MAKNGKKVTAGNQKPSKPRFEDLPSSKNLDLTKILGGGNKVSTKPPRTPSPQRFSATEAPKSSDNGFRRNGGKGRRGWGGRLKPHELAKVL